MSGRGITQSHHDHVAGDTQFADRPRTTVVGEDLDSVWKYFGYTQDPGG